MRIQLIFQHFTKTLAMLRVRLIFFQKWNNLCVAIMFIFSFGKKNKIKLIRRNYPIFEIFTWLTVGPMVGKVFIHMIKAGTTRVGPVPVGTRNWTNSSKQIRSRKNLSKGRLIIYFTLWRNSEPRDRKGNPT